MARRGFNTAGKVARNVSGHSEPLGSSSGVADDNGNGTGSNSFSLDGIATADPARAAVDAGDGGNTSGNTRSNRTGRGPGRPAGSGSANATKSTSAVKSDGQAATAILSSIHQMLALYLNAPGIALSQKEAEDLGAAIAEVQKFYPASVFDPKYTAWAALAMTAFRIEAPRAILAVSAAKKRKVQGNAPT